ncbi:MAG: methylated-DNA--[protein]-cysteine S-methyltransferase [Actinomycetota bacterium]
MNASDLEKRLAAGPPASLDLDDLAATVAGRAEAEGVLDVAWTTTDSPLGSLVLMATEDGLVMVSYHSVDAAVDEAGRRISPRVLKAPARLDPARRELEEYFAGTRQRFDVPLDWRLVGPFQQRVLSACAAIPFGHVSTYQEMAASAGNPRASRAAGNALGRNPMPIVVPCHRVLRSGGGFGGYTGGIDKKRTLLELEGVILA